MGKYPVKNVGRKAPQTGGIVLIEQIFDKENNASLKDIIKAIITAINSRLGDLQVINISSSIEHGSVKTGNSVAYGGQEVTLTAIPSTGYEFSEWNVTDADGDAVTVTGNKFIMPSKDVTVSATFTAIDYPITYTSGEHGTVDGDETANMGDEVTLTVTPEDGYEINELTAVTGETPITITNNKFTMPAGAVEVSATFKETVTP